MDDNFETKPIQLITDEEKIKDTENQRRLSKEFMNSDYGPKIVALFESSDPRFERPIIAILTYGLNAEGTVGAIQVSNPYLGTYLQRLYEGERRSNKYYFKIKEDILRRPTTKLFWEGKMNKGITS